MTFEATTEKKVLTEERRLHIVQMLSQQDAVSSELLGERFGVSLMTVYRDLKALEAKGRLKCVRGGAVKIEQTNEPFFDSKRSENGTRKDAIARYSAQHFVDPGDIVILEAGTTVTSMIKYLPDLPLTLVTNGLATLQEATSLLPTANILGSGGMLRAPSHTFVGPDAEHFFRKLRARTLFLSATALDIPHGITDPNPLEIQIKVAMADSSERVILLLDSSKFSKRSLAVVLPFERLHAIVTNSGAPTDALTYLKRCGVETHVVDAS